MRIAIAMPGGYALVPRTDGRKSQIVFQADALERLGHEVVRMNPWESYDLASFDALHMVEGGLGNSPGVYGRIDKARRIGMAPFIDTSISGALYRVGTWLGSRHPRFLTQQGIFRRQAANCDIVIARSKDEVRLLVEGVGVPPEKVKVVLNGVTAPGEVDPEAVRAKFGITGDFALHISMFTQDRKNVRRLIEAIGPLGYPLIIAGTRGPEGSGQDVLDAAAKFPTVRILGQLSREDRDSLYAACKVFCLPSIYEGTGLVALEAASYGASVVITKEGGPPDYFADLAQYVDPLSVDSIRAAIRRAWEAPKDGRLRQHVLRNLSWEASARSLVAAYESVPVA